MKKGTVGIFGLTIDPPIFFGQVLADRIFVGIFYLPNTGMYPLNN